MPAKLTTSIQTLQTETITTSGFIITQHQATETMRNKTIIEQESITTAKTILFLNVQRLMAIMRAINVSKMAVILEPAERIQTLTKLFPATLEEETIQRKRILPTYKMETYAQTKQQRLTRQLIEEDMRLYRLYERSILMIEQQNLARFEKWLWMNYPIQTIQVLGKMLEQCIKKLWYMERIEGLEHLQRIMAQEYLYIMMEYPKAYNMIGMKITPLTMSVLKNRSASIYATMASSKQEYVKVLSIMPAYKILELIKFVQSGKKRISKVPQRINVGVTEDLTPETLISTGKDEFDREWFFIALRYAYSIPYWIRRMIARTLGMPEYHKYALYFGIGCIPTRRTMKGYKRQRYGREPWSVRQKEEYLKWYRERYGHYPTDMMFSGRYGGFKFDL